MKCSERLDIVICWFKSGSNDYFDTKKATKAWLKGNKFKQKHSDFLYEFVDQVEAKRVKRREQKMFRLWLNDSISLPISKSYMTMQKRLISLKQKRRKANIRIVPTAGRILRLQDEKLDSAFQHLKSTHGSFAIRNADKPSYDVETESLGRYSSSCTYQKTGHNIVLKFPYKKFLQSIKNKDLGGTTNLWCLLGKTVGDIEIYRACWLKKGRGYEHSVNEGYILKCGDVCYHLDKGKSLKRAIQNLRNKIIRQRVLATIPMFSGDVKFTDIKKLLEKVDSGVISIFDNLRVYRSRSIGAGNCVPGTDEFIDVHGFSGKKGGITLREFCESRILDNQYWSEKMATIGETIKKGYEQGKIDLDDLKVLAGEHMPELLIS